MCAIFGALGSFSVKNLHSAFESLSHRGPDDSSVFTKKDLFFASHRLAIVDPKNPQVNSRGGVHIAFNGEIYNYKEVKKLLKDYDFQSRGDSEVLLAAYLTWGEAFIEKIEGMFAIAILDEAEDSLTLYRDRLGKKPLYYYHQESQLVFSSEIKAILELGIHFERRKDVEQSFLSFQTALAPDTFYKDIYSLQAGQKLRFMQESVTLSFYDDILPSSIKIRDEKEAEKVLEDLLTQSVSKRVTSLSKPVFLLSGGLDSSLMCAMAQKESKEAIETFSLGYEGESKHDETSFAKEVADYIGAKNERVVYRFEDFKRDINDPFLWTDQPLNDPAMFPLAHLLKTVKQQTDTKVVLSGEGSDELFLGYRPYKEFASIEPMSELTNKDWLKNFLLKHPDEHREWEWYRRVLEDELLFRSSAESFNERQKKKLFKDKVLGDIALSKIQKYHNHFQDHGIEDPLLWYRYIDLKVHQSDYFLMKLDRVSMYCNLEARTPFLDETLVKRAMEIDSRLFLKDGVSKYLLKRVALNYLPASIVERKKRGFSYPFVEWLEAMGAFKTMRQLNDKHQLFDALALKEHLRLASKGAFKQHTFGMYLLLVWLESKS